MNVLNQTPSTRLGNYAPKQVFLGLASYNPFNVLYAPHTNDLSLVPLDHNEIKESVLKLQHSLERIHKPIVKKREDRRHTQEHSRLHQRNLRQFRAQELGIRVTDLKDSDCLPKFCPGDFVLVAQARLNGLSKLTALWRGPYRVTRALSDYVYEVEHLVTLEVSEVHITRLRFYADSSMDVPVPLLDEVMHENTLTFEYHIEDILSHTFDTADDAYKLQIKWSGFSDLEVTWEALSSLYEDQPTRVTQYISSLPDTDRYKQDMLRVLQIES